MITTKNIIALAICAIPIFAQAQSFINQTPAYPTGGGIRMKSIYAVDTNIAYIAGTGGNGVAKSIIQKTSDGGQTWVLIDSTNGNYDYAVCFYDADTGYVAGTTVRKTTDGGSTWQMLNTPYFDYYSYSVYIKSAADIWVIGPQNKFLHSIDYGLTWTLDSIGNYRLDDIIFVDNNTGFISGIGGFLYKTTDGGNTWYLVNIGTTNDLWSPVWSGSRLFLLSGFRADDIFLKADTICFTDDFINWTCQRLDTPLNKIVFINDSVGFGTGTAGTSSWTNPGHVLRTTNKGQTWEIIFSSPCYPLCPDGFYQLSFADENTGWVMSEYRIYKTTNGIATGIKEFENNPLESYPNPCTDRLSIETNNGLNTTGVLVYDMLGKKYNCLFNTTQDKIEFNISNLESGVYFYKIYDKEQKMFSGKFVKINN